MEDQIGKLEGHYIVCGYGRIGRVLTQYLVQKYNDVVVVEKDGAHEAQLEAIAGASGGRVLWRES